MDYDDAIWCNLTGRDVDPLKVLKSDSKGWFQAVKEGDILQIDFPSSVRSCYLDVKSCFQDIEEITDLATLKQALKQEFRNIKQPLLKCQFQTKSRLNTSNSIKIMQWNMLSQALSTGKDNFSRCPPSALELPFRALRILEEIANVDADIVCLQEVDLFGTLHSVLSRIGYNATFLPKPDSPALYCGKSYGPDGCAIFHKTDKLKLIDCERLILKRRSGTYTNQVCLVGIFKSGQNVFCVANTHLKARKGWEFLREEQGIFLIEHFQKYYNDLPLFICGDFNGDPSENVYKVITASTLNLCSSYKYILNSEPKYTTWKIRGGRGGETDIRKTVDYIFCNSERITINAIKELPDEQEIGEERLPGFHYPSDHLSLAIEFVFKT